MAMNRDDVARLTSPPSSDAKSPDSDVSPGTKVPAVSAGYFSTESGADGDQKLNGKTITFAPVSTDVSTTTLTSISEEGRRGSRQDSNDSDRPFAIQRKSSTASVTFRPPRNPSLPQGNPRKTDNRRLRESSPSPINFALPTKAAGVSVLLA
ncbi:hypothetical protein N0V88_001880 [Collariella sp. IMI 366227]|nr:hypothetical protein N0V88_001880 [Collariella sp. IMI 366227]